jgi:hypothetical protein
MKLIPLLLLLAACDCCPGQADTNLIAAGNWSEAVRDGMCWASLRGRLLVYCDEAPSTNNHARVYLELQHVQSTNGWNPPVAVFYAPDKDANLHCEMSDEAGLGIHTVGGINWYSLEAPCWVTLPCDATLRLRVSFERQLKPKPSGLEIHIGGDAWVIPPHTTNGFYLSGTFSPRRVDAPNLPRSQVWQETLTLLRVKIPVK